VSTREISRRSVLQGAVGIAAVQPILVSFDARAADAIKLTLPWIPEGEVAFMYAAKKHGFWEKRGLDVSIARGFGSGEAAKNVGLGRFDFGQADIGAMIRVAGSELPLISIAMVSQKSTLCIITQKGIKTPKDLEGKRLGGSPASAPIQIWPAFAGANNIDDSKIMRVSLQPGVDVQAFVNREVDALATLYQSAAPYLWADKVEFDNIYFAEHGLDIYSLTFITRPDNIKNGEKKIAAFVDGVMEGLKFSYLEPTATLEDFVAAVPESGKTERDRTITRHSLMINTAAGLSEDAHKNGLGWHNPAKVETTLKLVNSFLKLEKVPAASTLYTNEFVGNVKLTDAEWQKARELAKNYLFG
jgi:ABC-type nitrate/sulfonate/bicarbonate transport system substrate-binding protein